MSAAEIIEQIKVLPPEEQRTVLAFVTRFATEETAAPGVRTVSPDVFTKAKAAVFAKHDDVLRRLAQ